LTKERKTDTTADAAEILAEIARLRALIPQALAGEDGQNFMLERYLEDLNSYAETVCDEAAPEESAAEF
jgi:hypothetical protein